MQVQNVSSVAPVDVCVSGGCATGFHGNTELTVASPAVLTRAVSLLHIPKNNNKNLKPWRGREQVEDRSTAPGDCGKHSPAAFGFFSQG